MKIWALLVGLIVGVIFSFGTGFVQADRMRLQGHTVYYGVPLAVAILVTVLIWLNRHFQSRLPGAGTLLGWIVATWQLTIETSGGDLGLVPALHVNAYLIAGSLCLGMAAAAPIFRPLNDDLIQSMQHPLVPGNDHE